MFIKTDVMGSKILNTQKNISEKVQESMNRLSTGLRINSASDDSSGLAISERLKASINQNQKEIQNINDYISKAKLKDSTLNSINDMLMRIRELTIQQNNGTLSNNDKTSIINEKLQLINTINQVAQSTTFNGKSAIDIETGMILDGVRDYAKVDKNVLSPTMTLQFTVKPENNKTMHYLHASQGSSGDGFGSENETNFSFSPTGSSGFFIRTNNRTNVLLPSGILPVGEWSNVAVVIDSENNLASYYINGEMVNSVAINGTIDFSNYEDNMLIGMSKSFYDRDYGGNLKDALIYDKALTQDELKSNMSGETVTGGLTGNWSFRELAGNTAEDKSNQGNDAMLFGDATFHLDFDEYSDLPEIDAAIDEITKLRTDNGSKIVSHEFTIDYLSNKGINETNAKSRIREADISSVSSKLIQEQIKLQTSNQMLQRNNSNRETVLSLLAG